MLFTKHLEKSHGIIWISKDVNLPPLLINTQRDGKLVVFAGAGISIDPPSNLPDFKQLAIQIAGGTLELEKDEPIDQFFGKLKDRGIPVHLKTQEILSNPMSKPNSLHCEILSLFRSQNELRLVTTNSNRHFTTVVQERFGNSVEIYCYTELRDKKIATNHPESVVQLLRHLLSHAHGDFLHCNEVEELVRSLVGSAASRSELILVCDDLARLGCPNAAELRKLRFYQDTEKICSRCNLSFTWKRESMNWGCPPGLIPCLRQVGHDNKTGFFSPPANAAAAKIL